jgi:antirestriction protein ArdC
MNAKPDIHAKVTNRIIADLERGNLTWLRPWQSVA